MIVSQHFGIQYNLLSSAGEEEKVMTGTSGGGSDNEVQYSAHVTYFTNVHKNPPKCMKF